MAKKFLSDIELDAGLVDINGNTGTSGQILSSTGSGVDWINAPSGTIDGSGTTNNMVKWTSGTTIGDSLITDNGSTISLSTSGSSNTFDLSHTSGSGVALNITKGGNNEGLIVNKTSGSGNAVSITGDSYFNGDVGIGAASPDYPLHISSSESSGDLLFLHNSNNAAGAAIRFSDNTTSTSQNGTITYRHSDSQSQGGGASFHFIAEPDTALVLGNSTNKGRFVSYSQNSTSEVDYGFGGNVNTGMYSPSSNQVGLVASGSRKLLVNTDGVTIQNGRLYLSGTVDTNTSSTTALVLNGTEVEKRTLGSAAFSNTGDYVAVTGDTMSGNLDVNADIQGNTFTQAATGNPRNNLGSPTVTEMALFDSQFTPKTTLANDYNDLSDLTFWTQSTSSSSWTEVTTYSDDQKRRFLRTANSSVIIPNNTYKFRVEFRAKSYTFANALYGYWSSNSHKTKVHIYKYNQLNSAWTQHTSSSTEISSWPGHMYLPFSTIAWHETNTTSSGHYRDIRIEFTPTWVPYSGSGTDYSSNNINIYGLEIWGGYPSGRRTPHYYDQNGKLNTWGDLQINGNAYAPIFYDSDNTNYYVNPASTSELNVLNLAGDLSVGGGDIVLEGTGRIQGVDTVSANTDAANKLYVDNAVAGNTNADTLDNLDSLQFLRSDVNDDFSGTLNYTPDTGTILSVDGQAILQRMTANGAITIGHDDAVIIAGGDTSGVLNSNINNATETVFIGAEGGMEVYAFPNNDTSWSNRQRWVFQNDGKLLFGQGGDTNIYRSATNTLKTDDNFIVGGGNITLEGTGRIQGIDTVSAGTDAANKTYVDNAVAGVSYDHPTHPGDDFSVDTGALTGAEIVSDIDINVTTDTLGHVTDANGTVSTRTLTLADLGYTGETDTLDSVADRGRTTNQQLISTNPSGFRVDSGGYARVEIDSNNNWSYIRLQDNAVVSWDIASYDGGNLELRPGGSSSNRTYFDSSGNSFSEGSKRAPIFYDSNDTTYYLDPASTGTSLNAAGDARVKNVYISNASGSVSNKIWFDNGGIYQPGLYFDGNNPKFIISSLVTSIFHDAYHPNADTWTTARTITIGNTGKTVDGSANVSWSLAEIGAASSSHNHDDRYYTETESDSRFLNVAGDTATGSLRFQNDLNYFGTESTNNEAEIVINTGVAGSPQIGFTEHGDASWAIGIDDGDNSFKIHGTANATIPTINGLGTPIFELTTSGIGYFGTQRIFADNYHPNADTLTTARTISLTGDVTGSVSFNGSSNVSITTTVANNSHQHNVLYENSTITYGASQLQWMDINGGGGTGLNGSNPQNPTSDWHYHLLMNHANSNGYYIDLAFDFHDDNVWFQRNESGTLQGWRQMFHDGYHPNADTWTSSRTITIGNTGKSVNGSANVSWSLSEIGAAASSHTHDDRYYTETEMQTFFNRGYISNQSATNAPIGWYTIATNTGNRALGEFQIWDVASSRHQSVLFNASHHYGTDNSNDITVLANSRFGTDVFRYIRIKEGGTYDGAALQVYIDNSSNAVRAAITGANAQESGWVLKDWIADATDPGDVDNYSSFTSKCQVDLDNTRDGGIATTGNIYSGGATTQYRNLTTADEGSGNGLDADTLDGQHASAFASSSHNHDSTYVNVSGDTMTGPLTITDGNTGLLVDSAGHASIRLDRGSTSYDNNLLFYTGGALKWRIWQDGSDNQLMIRDDANSYNSVIFNAGGASGYTTFVNSARAPIFYDSDNTSYYLNPTSTSVLNDVSGVRIWAGYDSNVDNSVSCSNWFRSSGSTGWYNASYGGGIYMADSTWVRVYNNKKFFADNTIESNTAMYAPIFYDRNNTNYRFNGDASKDSVDLTSSGNYAVHVLGTISGGHRKHGNLETPEMQWSIGGGTDLNWKKLCDIVISDANYAGWGAEIEITNFSGNYGNAMYSGGELFKGALSIYHWGGSGTTPEIAYANIPYEMRSHVRWYKINETGQNRYQLQVKSPGNYQQLYIKVKPGIGNQIADIISYANDTNGVTSGGTAYSTNQNTDFNHEFAGGIWTNGDRYIGWKNIYGSPFLSTYYGSITTSAALYVGGPTGSGQDLYCDDLRSNKVFDRAATAYYFEGGNTGDSIRVAGDVVAYYSSDKRLKDNIKPIENALEKVNAISGVTFEWNEKSHKTTGRKDVGVVAQEVEEVFPELVETRTNGYKAVDYQKLTAVLIESVKELTAKVEALEAKQCNCK